MNTDTELASAIDMKVDITAAQPSHPIANVRQQQMADAVQSGSPNLGAHMSLVQMGLAQGASIDQMERLMAMAERNQANEAKQAFTDAMAKFKANPPEIIKDKQVSFDRTNYMHATIGAVCDAIIAGLAEVGISHSWKPRQTGDRIGIACILTHRLGHSDETYLEAGADTSGKKNGIQSIGSTTTYLSRYTLLMACGLATKDQDDDGRSHKDPIPTWVDEHIELVNLATTREELEAAWKTAAAACRRRGSRAAYDDIKFAVVAKAETFAPAQEKGGQE